MGGVAYGNMEFVRCNDTKPWIPEFPPELVPYNSYLDGRRRFRCILDGVNHAGCSGEQHRNDQDWNHGPGQFNLCTPVYLSWLACMISCFAAELYNHISQQGKDHQENQTGNGQHEER